MDDNKIIRSYINERVAEGEDKSAIINELKNSGDARIKFFLIDQGYSDSNKPEDKPLESAIGLAEAIGGMYAGKKLIQEGSEGAQTAFKSIRDRFLRPQADITASLGSQTVAPTAPKVPEIVQGIDVTKLDPQMQEIVRRSEQNRIAKQQEATRIIDQQIKGFIGQHTPAPPAPPTPVSAAPAALLGTPEVPTVAQLGQQALGQAPVAPPQTVAQVAAEVAPTTEAKPSETKTKAKGRPTKEAQAKAMEGLTFRSDLGPGDNWLFNSFGGEGRKAILAQYNEGKPAGSYENAQQIFKKMQEERFGPGRSELPRDIAKERGVVPPETNYGKLGKTAKMAGIAGLALTASQLAQAKNATQARQTIGEALLPFLATPSSLAEGTLPPEVVNAMMAERQKLGSPYRSVPPQ